MRTWRPRSAQGDGTARKAVGMKGLLGAASRRSLTLALQDSKGNTPLHYAAGYGRGEVVLLLLDAGANAAAKNATGKTPLALVRLSKDNPINADEDILYKLEQGANASV